MAVATDVASALRELHAAGVVHGDAYAHNILYVRETPDVQPRAKLGDFGAAFFYDVDHPSASTIQRNEAPRSGAPRGRRPSPSTGVSADAVAELTALARTLLGDRTARLTFDAIVARLADIATA